MVNVLNDNIVEGGAAFAPASENSPAAVSTAAPSESPARPAGTTVRSALPIGGISSGNHANEKRAQSPTALLETSTLASRDAALLLVATSRDFAAVANDVVEPFKVSDAALSDEIDQTDFMPRIDEFHLDWW
jgi:hypothetical protein